MSIADDHMDVKPIRPSKDAVSAASYRESIALSKKEDDKSEVSDVQSRGSFVDSPKSRHSGTASLRSATASVKSGSVLSGSKKSDPESVARSRPSKQISNRYSN